MAARPAMFVAGEVSPGRPGGLAGGRSPC